MTNLVKCTLPLLAVPMLAIAGGLKVEIGNPQANPEAKNLNASLVARVVACHEPAESNLTASAVTLEGNSIRRTPLRVEPLTPAGTYAIIGAAGPTAVIEVAVTNPQYGDYRPTLLVRLEQDGIKWASLKRFSGEQPTAADVRAVLGAETRAALRP